MPKYNPNTLTGSFASVGALNNELQEIARIINDELLSRNNATGDANQLESDLDINSQRLYNIPNGTEATHAVNYAQLLALSGFVGFDGTVVETATSADAQTEFNLSSASYTPGLNNIAVYINGVLQTPGVDYSEPSSTRITFLEGLELGDSLLFVINTRPVDASSFSAASTTITVNGVATNVSSYLNSVNTLVGSVTQDWGSIASQATTTANVTVTGATADMVASAYMDVDLQGIILSAHVSATNTVSVRATNPTASPIDLPSATLTVRVHKDVL